MILPTTTVGEYIDKLEKLYKAKLLENNMGYTSLERNDNLDLMDSETLQETAIADLERGFELGRKLSEHLGEYGESFSPVEFLGVAEFFAQLAESLAADAESVLNTPQDNTQVA